MPNTMPVLCMYYFYLSLFKMYMNAPNTARMQVSEGYIISFKKVLSCFYFKKQLLEGCQILSSTTFKLFIKEDHLFAP